MAASGLNMSIHLKLDILRLRKKYTDKGAPYGAPFLFTIKQK